MKCCCFFGGSFKPCVSLRGWFTPEGFPNPSGTFHGATRAQPPETQAEVLEAREAPEDEAPLEQHQTPGRWAWLKINQEGQTAGFGPCFHSPARVPFWVPVF